jgi:hypothetical protein
MTTLRSLLPAPGSVLLWLALLLAPCSLLRAQETVTLPTVAALKAADPRLLGRKDGTGTLKATVDLQGYWEERDGGGGRIEWADGSSATADDGIVFESESDYTDGRWIRPVTDGNVSAKWWGPKQGTGVGAANAVSLQAAINFASSLNGGTVFLPELYRLSSTLTLYRNVKLISARPSTYTEAATLVTNATLYKGGYAGGLAVDTGANISLLRGDSTGGYLRQTNISMWDGTTAAEKRFLNSGCQNLLLLGNNANQTNTTLPLIDASYMWNLSIEDCYFGDSAGPAVWFRDMNGVRFYHNFIQGGRGVIVDDTADSDFSFNQGYGSAGPSWLILSSWKNTFIGNHVGNAQPGLEGTVSSVSGNVLTASAAHSLSTGRLLWTYATTSLPSPLVSTRPYYVIWLSSNTFSLATTLTNAQAGTAVTLTTAGSGTITYTDGGGCSWLLCSPAGLGNGTKRNSFIGNRSDQTWGSWLRLDGATENTFVGNYAIEGGYYTNNIVRAVVLTNAAANNVFVGNIIDNSWDYGFSVGDNCDANVFAGNSVLATTPWEWGATGTSANYVPVAGQGSGTNIYGGTLAIGQAASGNVVTFTGNASGTRVIKAVRTSGLTQSLGLGVGSSAWNLWNETAGVGMALIGGTATETSYLGGAGSGGASPRQLVIRPEDASSGTDSPGTNLVLQASSGTGNSTTGGKIQFSTPDAGASGTTVQTKTVKMELAQSGALSVTGGLTLHANGTKVSRIRHGRATLVAGSVAVSDAYVTTSTRILLSVYTTGGTVGHLHTGTRSAGVSFTITSSSGTDTSVVDWVAIEP